MGHSDKRNVRTRCSTGLNPCIELVFISRGEAIDYACTPGVHTSFRNLEASSKF